MTERREREEREKRDRTDGGQLPAELNKTLAVKSPICLSAPLCGVADPAKRLLNFDL